MSADQAALAHGLACDHESLVSRSPRARSQAPSPGAGKNPIPRPSPARGSTSTNRLPAPPSKSRPGAKGHARATPSNATWAKRVAGPLGRLRRSLQHQNDPFRRLQSRNPRARESTPLSRWHGTRALPNAGGFPPAAIADGVSGRLFSYAVTASRLQHLWL